MTTQVSNGLISIPYSRNIIINGNMDVKQRTSDDTGTVDAETLRAVDMWSYYQTSSARCTFGQAIHDFPTYAESGVMSTNAIYLSVVTADASLGAADIAFIRYAIEGQHYRRLAGGPTILSFWVKAPVAGTYCVAVRDDSNARSYVSEYTVAVANTWEKHEILITLDDTVGTFGGAGAQGGLGCTLTFSVAAGANTQTGTTDTWISGDKTATANQVNALSTIGYNFRITQVQWEKGAAVTPFEDRSYAEEEELCRRYFQTLSHGGYNYESIAQGQATSATVCYPHVPLITTMRADPALTTIGNWRLSNGVAVPAITSFSFNYSTKDHLIAETTVASGLTAGNTYSLQCNNDTSARIFLSAEL